MIWSDRALADLESIRAYIRERNPRAARRMVSRIVSVAMLLEDRPLLGRAGRIPGTREWTVAGTPYIIIYVLHDRTVAIARIRHSARRWPRRL